MCWNGASVGPDSTTGVLALKGILVRAPAPPCGNTTARAANNTSDERPIIGYQPVEAERRFPHAQCRLAEYSRQAALA